MAEPGDYGRRLASGTAVNACGAIVGQVLELLTVAVIVKRIGGSAFGVIVLAQGWALLPYLIESGIGQRVVRSVSASEGDRIRDPSILSTGVAFYVGLGMLTMAAGLAASLLLLDSVFDLPAGNRATAMTAFNLVMAAGAVRLGAGFVPRILVGATRLPALRAVGLIRSTVMLGATVILVGHGPPEVADAGLALLLADVVAAVAGLMLVVPRHFRPRIRDVNREAAARYVRESRPVAASSGAALLSSRLDPIIIAVALGPVATAAYGVVLKAYDVLRSATELLSLVLMPASARALSRNEPDQIARLFQRALLYIALLVWPFGAAVALFAEPVLRAWVGSSVPGAARPLATAMVLGIALAPSAAAFYIISGARRVGSVLTVQLGAGVVNLAIELLLVRHIGVAAVFLGSLTATLLVTGPYLRVVADLAHVSVRNLLSAAARPALAVTGVAVLLGLVRVVATGAAAAALVGAVLAAYGVTAVLWLTPRRDFGKLVPIRR